MKTRWMLFGSVMLSGLSACAMMESMGEDEKEIPLSEVPQNVLDAAKAAVPGIELTEAEVEDEDGTQVYEVEGKANGQEYEIEVSAAGKVLEVEKETDDDGEDDD